MIYRRYRDIVTEGSDSKPQVAMFYAVRFCNGGGCEDWDLAIAIAGSRKECRRSVRVSDVGIVQRRRKGKALADCVTGRHGLKGLVALKKMLLEFLSVIEKCGKSVEVTATPYDERRERVYKYLLKCGFEYFPPLGEYFGRHEEKAVGTYWWSNERTSHGS